MREEKIVYKCDLCSQEIEDTCGKRFEMKVSTPCSDKDEAWIFDFCLTCIWKKLKDVESEKLEWIKQDGFPEQTFSWATDSHRG